MELLQVADAVAREKGIDKSIVVEAMQEAIEKAGRSKYGHDHDIRAVIDDKNCEITLKRYREVVDIIVADEDDEDGGIGKIELVKAKRIKPDAVIGDMLIDDLQPLDFGRIAAQTAKQVIMQ